MCGDRRSAWRDLVRSFRTDEKGSVAITFALIAIVLMLAIGAAVDVGRWLHARDQTIAAVDAAVLAGGRALQLNGKDHGAAIAAATKYYQENVTSRLPVINDTVSFAVKDDGMGVTASGSAYIKTPFLQFARIEKLPLISTSQTTFAQSQIAVGGNGGENIEVSMMLDVTGSMAGQKLQDLKDAAKDLINIVIWDDQSKFTSKVALVPFSEDIRLPSTSALPKARGSPDKTKTVGKTTYYLSDCVVERTGAQKYTDAAPASGQYVMAHYTEQTTGKGKSKKGVCTIPAGAEIVALTDDKQTLLNKVDGLSAAGGTAGHLGTAWAWYTLSPNWWNLWPSAHSRPAAYGTADLRKIAILMTDGEYNTQYDSNGIVVRQSWGGSCSGAANGCSTDQARALCAGMKAKGITVYTVGFDIGSDSSTAAQTLRQCATDPTKYYNAGDGEELKQAFRDIALKLSSLYISK
ncbi:MAG: VWA domain-containing protein [Hyphomicrobium sp.]|uniref:vWA domain-containing protein n=1 Tax=Hyphomicrobium sp. TaxID=82 RepID=UPI001329B896|nr:pilus assembly protein [Hyphomicrobium sp.]KAB2937859.1 MAG: VWA domain-containing protein [Hyphomicrobium sp.]MBZ0210070.1 VWA domain-containing protein [Hyphomicrobium sp.]